MLSQEVNTTQRCGITRRDFPVGGLVVGGNFPKHPNIDFTKVQVGEILYSFRCKNISKKCVCVCIYICIHSIHVFSKSNHPMWDYHSFST